MSKIAFVFPGQGSQVVGMGKDVFEFYPQAKTIFEAANTCLGESLSSLCFHGPEEELKLTYHTQPALLTTSIALYEAGKNLLPVPHYVAGHSLGEYTALVVAGVLSFEEAVVAVKKRGLFMNEAVPSGVGAMAAVLGGSKETIQEVCQQVTKTSLPVQIANVNCPGQIVISGTKEGVEAATVLLKEKGIKKVIPLPVSGPFHSSLMQPARDQLETVLENTAFHEALIPVVSNIDAQERKHPTEIKDSLLKQVCGSVLWEESVQYMIDQGVTTFVEIGSGKVLTGLIKKISRDVTVYNIFDQTSLNDVVEKLATT